MSTYLNIGSGQRPFQKPWINVEPQAKYKPDIVATSSELLLVDDYKGKCDLVCLHHVIEHFGCGEADQLLRDCLILLKRRGSLLIFLPDLRALAEGWMIGKINTQIYMTNLYGAYMESELDRHKWGYTFESLRDTLRKVGFGTIKAFDWRDIEGADIACDWWVMGVEAIR